MKLRVQLIKAKRQRNIIIIIGKGSDRTGFECWRPTRIPVEFRGGKVVSQIIIVVTQRGRIRNLTMKILLKIEFLYIPFEEHFHLHR